MVWLEVSIEDVTQNVVGVFRDPAILFGIPLALLGAVFMSFGAQYQHRGVAKVERLSGSSGSTGLTGGQLLQPAQAPLVAARHGHARLSRSSASSARSPSRRSSWCSRSARSRS